MLNAFPVSSKTVKIFTSYVANEQLIPLSNSINAVSRDGVTFMVQGQLLLIFKTFFN